MPRDIDELLDAKHNRMDPEYEPDAGLVAVFLVSLAALMVVAAILGWKVAPMAVDFLKWIAPFVTGFMDQASAAPDGCTGLTAHECAAYAERF